MSRIVAVFLPVVVLCSAAPAAQADEPQAVGEFQDWQAYTQDTEGGKTCFAIAKPASSQSSREGTKRDPIHFMVANWPGRNVKAQPSTIIGYPFKEGSVVTVVIDDKSFDLYPVDDTAWADKAETEKAIITAMKSGKKMMVKGTSQRGTETTDTYSLAGISAALEKIDSACE